MKLPPEWVFEMVRDTHREILSVPAEIRLRYHIPPRSFKILPYYLLNPFLMLVKKALR